MNVTEHFDDESTLVQLMAVNKPLPELILTDICHHIASQGPNGLTHIGQNKMAGLFQMTFSYVFSQKKCSIS